MGSSYQRNHTGAKILHSMHIVINTIIFLFYITITTCCTVSDCQFSLYIINEIV